jgi:cell division protein FtsB
MRTRQIKQGLLLGLLVLTIGWLFSSIWGLANKALVAISHARETKAAYELLESRRVQLEASLGALNTERGRDAAVRTAFGVARPGEEVIVVVPPPATTTPVELSWWKRLFSW